MKYIVAKGNSVYSKKQRMSWLKIQIGRHQFKKPQKSPRIRLKLGWCNLGDCETLTDKLREREFYAESQNIVKHIKEMRLITVFWLVVRNPLFRFRRRANQ